MNPSIKVKTLILSMFFIILLLAFVAGCAPSEPAAGTNGAGDGANGAATAPLELRLAHFFPASHPAEKILVQGWADRLNTATDGQISIESYPGETLLAAAEIYDGVQTGITDIGLSCFSYTRGRFPLLEAFELPGIVYLNSKVASKVAWEGIKQLNPAEVQDTKLLMALTTGPGHLFTKSPVNTLEDLQGMEIRATGLSAKTLEALGAIPVAMAQSEAYESLAKGVVKGNLSPLEVLEGWKHAEVTDYVTMTPFLYNNLFFVTMNKDVWDSIPARLQDIITGETEAFFEEVAIGLWDMQNDSGLEYAIRETNQQVIYLPDEEMARWMELIKPIEEDFVQEMNKLGLDGAGTVRMVKELSDKYNDIYR